MRDIIGPIRTEFSGLTSSCTMGFKFVTIQALPGSPISLGLINQMPEDEAEQGVILQKGPANKARIFQLNIFWSNGLE